MLMGCHFKASVPEIPYVVRFVIVAAIGALAGLLWIRIALYGFGLPVMLAWIVGLALLAAYYIRQDRLRDYGLLLAAFAFVWAAFEAWTWANASADPAVVIPGWSPVPFATAIALLIMSTAVAMAAGRPPTNH